jgi:hypothetical protein
VISRSTVNAFKNYDKPLPDIAREINVDYMVEASVLGFGDSITLQLRLIQVFPQEDVFFSVNMHMQRDRFNLPEKNVAKEFCVESVYYEKPLGIHKCWKYLPADQVTSLLSTIDYKT